jgi:hypothetical protein
MELTFSRRWLDDDGMLQVDVSARYGGYATYQDVYVYPDDLDEFGKRLAAYGASVAEEVVLEIGSTDERAYCWLRLRAFQYDAVGHSAIEVSTQRNGAPHVRARCQFTVPLEIASINALGIQIQAWAHGNDQPLSFEGYHG